MSQIKPGKYEVALDGRSCFVRVRVEGFWSSVINSEFLETLAQQVRTARANDGAVHVLVDARELAVQTLDVSPTYPEADEEIYRAGDRIAVVCTSALTKMQLQQSLRVASVAYFPSVAEAEAWLRNPD